MLIHPQFDPIALQVGPLAVRWYGLMYLAGFVAFLWLGRRRAAALDTPVSSIFALAEGRGEKAKLPDDFTDDDTCDHAAELMQLRRGFRTLTPANRRIAVELLKAPERTQT